jgi:hypothetical protein
MTISAAAGLAFDAPAHWSDRSVLIIVAPPGPGQKISVNILVARESRQPGEGPELHARRQLLETAAAHEGMALLETGATTVAGRPAFKVRYRVSTPAGGVEQIIFYVETRDATTLTVLSAGGPADGAWRHDFDHMVATARLDSSTRPAQPPARRPMITPPPGMHAQTQTTSPPALSTPRPHSSPPLLDDSPLPPLIPMPGERSPRRASHQSAPATAPALPAHDLSGARAPDEK